MEPEVALSVQQFVRAWTRICKDEPQYLGESLPGLEMVFSGVPNPFFNVGFTTSQIDSANVLGSLASRATAWAGQRAVPWFFAVTQDLVADGVDTNAVLAECGMAFAMRLTGMHADDVAPFPSQSAGLELPEGLELKVPQDDASCKALMQVNAAAYGMALDSLDCQLSKSDFWTNDFPVVGMAGGNPASCATVLMVDGFRYVALVATAPDHQRRGYADAAMRQALTHARQAHGAAPTTLHATEAGKPVYERMGYRSIATHLLYLDRRFMDA